MKKVLIVDDDDSWQNIYALALSDQVTIIPAFTIEDGERLFFGNLDINAIVMDACVPGASPTTTPLVKKIRQTFFGPMIAASSDSKYREILMTAGCDYQAAKGDVARKIIEILGL